MEHHPVFLNFRRFRGQVRKNDEYDFLGTATSPEFLGRPGSEELCAVAPDYPYPDDEYFEWIDLLESVVASGPTYTMMELGAGFGRWAVRAAFAARQLRKAAYKVIAVEAEPAHFQWMNGHFRNNDLDPRCHKLVHAAVSDEPGSVRFLIEATFGGPPAEWYGQFIVDRGDVVVGELEGAQYLGLPVQQHASGGKSIDVPAVTLTDLLSDIAVLDLLDMDIQGYELTVISQAIDVLNRKVRRLHIGTHSRQIETALTDLLQDCGWCCHTNYAVNSTAMTPWGSISFNDGVQSWTNQRSI